MEFKRKGPDVAEVTCRDGKRLLFSYGEPVAAFVPNPSGWHFLRVDEYISRTTESHIRNFIGPSGSTKVPRAEILRAVKEAC